MRVRRMIGTRAIALAAVGLLNVLSSVSAEAATVEWHNVPISIVLPVGQERVVSFPDHVQVGVPSVLPPGVLRTQSVGGTVLWLAQQPFGPQRLQVRLLTTGHVMLVDVTAVESDDSVPEPIEIVFPSDEVRDGQATRALGPVELTRFASQRLYAPARVLKPLPGVRRVPMGLHSGVDLYRDDQINALALGSWRAGGLYVTAVMLTHTGRERLTLDPRLLKGRFVAATFQHNSLGPVGSRSDTTCVYLVTDGPFVAAIDGRELPIPPSEGS